MRKLLKYDMQSFFKVWGIASLAALVLSVLGGVCLHVLVAGTDTIREGSFSETILMLSCMAGMFFAVIGLVAYGLLTTFFILRRYYTHFFTDEGYLTFTLPVKRSQLLGAKVLLAVCYDLMALLVMVLCVGMMLMIGLWQVEWQNFGDFLQLVPEALRRFNDEIGGFLPVYLTEFLALILAGEVCNVLYTYLCITIGAVVAKKQKILAAIGIYYGGNMVFSLVAQVVAQVVMFATIRSIGYNESFSPAMLATFFGVLIVVLAGLAVAFWAIILRLLHRRLNLA